MSLKEDYDDEVTALYRKCAGRVQGFLINMGCDPGLAQEITNDAFLGARLHWVRVRALDEPEGYVFKIARNERSKRQPKHDSSAKDLFPAPPGALGDADEDPAQGVADRAAVRQALQQLPVGQREAITWRHIFGPLGGYDRQDHGSQQRHREALHGRGPGEAPPPARRFPPSARRG
jgi:DNA-directed RNA polymerase specialized sigma24 family protein